MKTLIPLFLSAALCAGCDAPASVAPDPAPVTDAGNVAIEKTNTPSSTEYTGEGKLVSREMKITRILSGYGVGAGEAIVSQKPMQVGESTTPATKITTTGVETTEGTQGKFIGASGGGTWTQMLLTKAKDWALSIGGILVFLVIGGAVLYFLVPAAKPIISGLLRFLASLFPVVGSLVESAVGKARVAAVEQPLVETVIGGQRFKDAIDARTDLTADQRAMIRQLFNDSMQLEQDSASQATVKAIKATL